MCEAVAVPPTMVAAGFCRHVRPPLNQCASIRSRPVPPRSIVVPSPWSVNTRPRPPPQLAASEQGDVLLLARRSRSPARMAVETIWTRAFRRAAPSTAGRPITCGYVAFSPRARRGSGGFHPSGLPPVVGAHDDWSARLAALRPMGRVRLVLRVVVAGDRASIDRRGPDQIVDESFAHLLVRPPPQRCHPDPPPGLEALPPDGLQRDERSCARPASRARWARSFHCGTRAAMRNSRRSRSADNIGEIPTRPSPRREVVRTQHNGTRSQASSGSSLTFQFVTLEQRRGGSDLWSSPTAVPCPCNDPAARPRMTPSRVRAQPSVSSRRGNEIALPTWPMLRAVDYPSRHAPPRIVFADTRRAQTLSTAGSWARFWRGRPYSLAIPARVINIAPAACWTKPPRPSRHEPDRIPRRASAKPKPGFSILRCASVSPPAAAGFTKARKEQSPVHTAACACEHLEAEVYDEQFSGTRDHHGPPRCIIMMPWCVSRISCPLFTTACFITPWVRP